MSKADQRWPLENILDQDKGAGFAFVRLLLLIKERTVVLSRGTHGAELWGSSLGARLRAGIARG
jgi:hypothetical protein